MPLEYSITNFLILYSVSRSLVHFQSTAFLKHVLGILSMLFLLSLPSQKYLMSTNIHGGKIMPIMLCRMLDTLSIRGIVLWINHLLQEVIGVSDEHAVILGQYLILIVLDPYAKLNDRVSSCCDILAFSCAQKTATLMRYFVSHTVSTVAFIGGFTVMASCNMCPHVSCRYMRLGASFSFIGSMNESIDRVAIKEEKLLWFLGLLVVIEILKEMVTKSTNDNPFFHSVHSDTDDKKIATHKEKKEVAIIPGMVPSKMTSSDVAENNENIILGTMTSSSSMASGSPVVDSTLGLPNVQEN